MFEFEVEPDRCIGCGCFIDSCHCELANEPHGGSRQEPVDQLAAAFDAQPASVVQDVMETSDDKARSDQSAALIAILKRLLRRANKQYEYHYSRAWLNQKIDLEDAMKALQAKQDGEHVAAD